MGQYQYSSSINVGVYISQLLIQHSEYLERAQLLTQKLQKSYFAHSHRYKNTIVITSWLIVTNYPCLKWQWTFSLLTRCVYYTKLHLFTLRGNVASPPFFGGGPCCSSFKFSVYCFLQRLLKINVGKCDRFIS